MNLDTGAAVNTFPSNFGPEGIGDGSSYDWIPDGEAWHFQGYDENGLPRSLMEHSRMHTMCWAAPHQHLHQHQHQELLGIACNEQQDFYVGHDGGYMIPDSQQFWSEK